MNSFTDKVALVTGAGSGLGAATAQLLARQGARVALLSCSAREIATVAREIRAAGGEALALRCDVTRSAQVRAAVEKIRKLWGRLDIVFANAGINGTWAPIEKLTSAEWNHTLATNLGGTFLTIQATVPLLRVRGGSIIVTSSVNGTRMFSNSGATAYACSKAAQVTLAKMLAVELARSRIRVNAVCPGFIESAIHDKTERRDLEGLHSPVHFPQGPIPLTGDAPGQPDQVAQLVLFLASEAADHITGAEIHIDGAQSLLQG